MTKDYLILFADLIGSTEVAVEVTPAAYAETYLASFHWAANKSRDFVQKEGVFSSVRFRQTLKEIRIAGDEIVSFTPIEIDVAAEQLETAEDIAVSAVAFAYVTKLLWLASPYNVQRLLGKQFPRDIAVGIHIGPAARVPAHASEDVAGLHINVAKRIESQARRGDQSKIFASWDVTDLFGKWRSRYSDLHQGQQPPLLFSVFLPRPRPVAVKGVPKKLDLLELVKDTEGSQLLSSLKQLLATPGNEDVETGGAARVMAEMFLPPGREPFSEAPASVTIPFQCNGPVTQNAQYIDCWFTAMGSPPKLFFNELWLVLDSFLVSCALLRHPDIGRGAEDDRLKRYREVTAALYERLQSVVGRIKPPPSGTRIECALDC